jgi:hypothetical protein
MGSSAFTLIYDLLNDPESAAGNLPWVYATLQNLSIMRAGDPIKSSIAAIQTVLSNINPSYEWLPYPSEAERYPRQHGDSTAISQFPQNLGGHQVSNGAFPSDALLGPLPDLPASQWNFPLEAPETGRSGGSSEDLLDFTQSDMGWNFDFSTMDIEAFFSVYPSMDTLLPREFGHQ